MFDMERSGAGMAWDLLVSGDRPKLIVPRSMSSDAGHLMCQGHPFSATYYDSDRARVFSLRSDRTGEDVSEVAKIYGGGGHARAAGFTVPIGWEGE